MRKEENLIPIDAGDHEAGTKITRKSQHVISRQPGTAARALIYNPGRARPERIPSRSGNRGAGALSRICRQRTGPVGDNLTWNGI